ncbi:MAG: thiosulfate oxidation carrier protein SoxY [Rhizobiales bacterium]|nr:thiosulfate oxidation carrier protein SoxY [Hyphomicrobiales bacterium]
MQVTRRSALKLGAGAAALTLIGLPGFEALADQAEVDKLIAEFTGGKKPESGRIALTAPEIAENGNSVPVAIAVESPMTAESHVAAVMLLAAGNPRPGVATFHFSPASGQASATTRIRLARTQDVVAIARMNDGSVFIDTKNVKVTIGGCGG